MLDSRNKKSLALDLRIDAGREVLYRLVRDADVFITNYPPPVRQRLKITYDDLAHLNERLIYASFTGYGETGPEANKPGFDATAWWARTGLMHLVRAGEEATPARSLPGMGDHPSSMGTYGAIVTALYQREKTGKGNYVSSSLLANGLWANGCSVQAALCGDKVAPQPPREAAVNALRVHLPMPRRALAAAVDRRRTNGAGTSSRTASTTRRSMIRVSRPREPRATRARVLVRSSTGSSRPRDLAHWRQVARRGRHHLRHRRRDARCRA